MRRAEVIDQSLQLTCGLQTYDLNLRTTDQKDTPVVNIKLAQKFEWSLEVASWRPMAVGVSEDIAYVWFARELIVLPKTSHVDPEIITADEDIALAYRADESWILVCETSIHRYVGLDHQHLHFNEVVEFARPVQGGVDIFYLDGNETRISTSKKSLSVFTDDPHAGKNPYG